MDGLLEMSESSGEMHEIKAKLEDLLNILKNDNDTMDDILEKYERVKDEKEELLLKVNELCNQLAEERLNNSFNNSNQSNMDNSSENGNNEKERLLVYGQSDDFVFVLDTDFNRKSEELVNELAKCYKLNNVSVNESHDETLNNKMLSIGNEEMTCNNTGDVNKVGEVLEDYGDRNITGDINRKSVTSNITCMENKSMKTSDLNDESYICINNETYEDSVIMFELETEKKPLLSDIQVEKEGANKNIMNNTTDMTETKDDDTTCLCDYDKINEMNSFKKYFIHHISCLNSVIGDLTLLNDLLPNQFLCFPRHKLAREIISRIKDMLTETMSAYAT